MKCRFYEKYIFFWFSSNIWIICVRISRGGYSKPRYEWNSDVSRKVGKPQTLNISKHGRHGCILDRCSFSSSFKKQEENLTYIRFVCVFLCFKIDNYIKDRSSWGKMLGFDVAVFLEDSKTHPWRWHLVTLTHLGWGL